MQQPPPFVIIPSQNAASNPASIQPSHSSASIPTGTQDQTTNACTILDVQQTAENVSADRTSIVRLKALLTMFVCSNREQKESLFNQRVQKLNDSKLIKEFSVRATRPSREGLGKEVLRRFKYLRLKDLFKQKEPRLKHWNIENCKERLSLPMYQISNEEKDWLEKELEVVLSHHETILTQQEDDADTFSLLPKISREKMRLFEAFFHPNNRSKLLRVDEVLNRRQLDARGSLAAEKSLYEDVLQLYNSTSWVPDSNTSDLFGDVLKQSYKLSFTGEKLDEKQTQRAWSTSKGELKKNIAGWRESGRGSGNLDDSARPVEEGGTENAGPRSNHNQEVQTSEDNRREFVNYPHIAYLWMLMDLHDIHAVVMQSLSPEVSYSSSNQNAQSNTSAVKPRNSKENKKHNQDKMVAVMTTLSESMTEQQHQNNLRIANNRIIEYRHLLAE